MSPEKIAAVVAGLIALVVLIFFVVKFLPKRIKKKKFSKKWQDLQVKCKDKTQWNQALVEADELLDEALKKRRIKGKTMGERMVSAQKMFSDNDSAWYGHKLRKKCEADPGLQPTRDQMKKALLGLGRALKDLGAL